MKNYLNASFLFALIDLRKDLVEKGEGEGNGKITLDEVIQHLENALQEKADETGL